MINVGNLLCPHCNNTLKYHDKVKRKLRTKHGVSNYIYIRRFKCKNCNSIHRELPENVLPYKHYELEIVKGVREGYITSDTIGFESFPSEETMKRWIRENYNLSSEE